jgi:hypothetical protein
MTAVPELRNRHPVDELADVRERMNVLGKREAELKAEVSRLMGAADSLGGDEYVAYQRMSERKGAYDMAAIKAVVDVEKYRLPPTAVLTIRVERRVREDAA